MNGFTLIILTIALSALAVALSAEEKIKKLEKRIEELEKINKLFCIHKFLGIF